MTGRDPVGARIRRILAATGLFCLAAGSLAAQPLNPSPASNPATNIALAEPTLFKPVGESNSDLSVPTKSDKDDFALAMARYRANTREYPAAEASYVKLLAEETPEPLRQIALFELAHVARLENDLVRAQAIYTQYLQRWPGDARTPEIYLRQGEIFRDMGLPNMALTKFYGVMTTALALTNNQFGHYQDLVLRAQVEIAETHYSMGRFKDAVDYYSRLLAQNDPELDREQIQFRLIRSYEAVNEHNEAASQALDFLAHYPDSPEEPEVRYHLAQAFKSQNRNTEALQR
jgi:tetratricopeptide (TPR) repeat protein